MRAQLIAAEGVDLAAIARAITTPALRASPKMNAPEVLVVVEPRHDPTGVAATVSDFAGRGPPVIVCTRSLDADHVDLLRECGARVACAPSDWSPEAVATRISAELMVLLPNRECRLGALFGGSAGMRALYQDIEVLGGIRDPILVLGETGTGKELVAREIHRHGSDPQIEVVNCAGMEPQLVRSELFGHVRGAFTGADRARQGVLRSVGRGTVFLDEIGELDPKAQAMLLRAVQFGEIRPVGSDDTERVEARLILATHEDLDAGVLEGTFRQDLLARIRNFTVELPPLRNRPEDLVLLAQHFLGEFNAEHETRRHAPDGAWDGLFGHAWPDNVRGLRGVVRRAAAFGRGTAGAIDLLRLEQELQRRRRTNAPATVSGQLSWAEAQHDFRRRYFDALLERADGNKSRAARMASMSRSQLNAILKQLEDV